MSHATQTAALTGETWEGWEVEFKDLHNGDVIQLVRWTKHLNRITVRLTNDADYLVSIELPQAPTRIRQIQPGRGRRRSRPHGR